MSGADVSATTVTPKIEADSSTRGDRVARQSKALERQPHTSDTFIEIKADIVMTSGGSGFRTLKEARLTYGAISQGFSSDDDEAPKKDDKNIKAQHANRHEDSGFEYLKGFTAFLLYLC
jgi:hypothetical protein